MVPMTRDVVRRIGTALIAANAMIAFLSLTNLCLVAAGAIEVALPDGSDLSYAWDSQNRSVLVGTSFSVTNKGIYSVHSLDISSSLVAPWGEVLFDYSRVGLTVPAGSVRTFPVVVALPIEGLAATSALTLLVQDGRFELSVRARALYTMGLTQFRSDDTEVFEWHAPLGQLRALLQGDGLPGAARQVLGWAEPIVREQLSAALLGSALAGGEWWERDVGGVAVLGARLALDEAAGTGSLDLVVRDPAPQPEWSVGGSIPLRIEDGMVYLAWEGMPLAA